MFKSILVIVILRNDEAVQNTKKCIGTTMSCRINDE
jgi:hypothetical protein